jgi:hypothetical protein
MNEAIEAVRNDVHRIVELRDNGMSVDEIVVAILEENMRKAIAQLLGTQGAPVSKPAPVTTPGYFAVIDGQRPAALSDSDYVDVILVNGVHRKYSLPSALAWEDVKEWRLAVAASNRYRWRDHINGESLPLYVRGVSRVDVRFDNGRIASNVLADDVDWSAHVVAYRVVGS